MKKLLLVICILLNFNVLAQTTKRDSTKLDSTQVKALVGGGCFC
jgi:hypothetical protein